MSIWFWLFWIVVFIAIFLSIKIIVMKNEISQIEKSLSIILKSDTNNLITVSSNDKDLKKLATSLNKNLKNLRKLELEYKQGNQELKASITNISHDLRTPLTAIRGYLDLIEKEKLENKQLEYLKIIDSKVKDLTELTEQLFDFSKGIDIYNEVERKNICINNILEDSIVSFYSLFKERNVTPKIEICEEKVVRLLNENMLKRIFENIISNAIKYSENDFNIKLESNGMIEFSNKTNLLNTTSLEKIFDRYYTVKNAQKSNGIGLSIAKQLVELSGGKIKAKYENNYLIIEIRF
ncbi:MAG: HAMP domain-containing histidine kinase [Clostridia bacterium]|nr:HAMP domain-containing histidine kinase [Clostridia bacterium]